MIRRDELQRFATTSGLREEVIEKDFAIGWVLHGIASEDRVAAGWAFKGGTCLKKCYIETYRFSEDLDFTVLPGGPIAVQEVQEVLVALLRRVEEASGLDVTSRPPLVRARDTLASVEARIYYRGPRGATPHSSLKVDLTSAERIVRPTVLRPISHPYSDGLPEGSRVRCYALDELFAEKIRAMGERGRPRDLYDIVNLFRRGDLRAAGAAIRTVLDEKCRSKGVPLPTRESVVAGDRGAELEAEWKNMLGHQLPVLPPLEGFLAELPGLFDWLEGKTLPAPMPAIPARTREAIEERWTPPATAWTFGGGERLEPVRFAAINHLCVELGYDGRQRLIEPYSLRRTRDGNLLLMAIRVEDREPRSYRVDRIESIRVSDRPFSPTYAIEFSAGGSYHAPQIERPRRGSRRVAGGPVYVVECARCGRTFRRRRRNTTLRPHKDANGWECRGSYGRVVDTVY